MRKKGFPINRIPPHILEMCREPYHVLSYGDGREPIDYLDRFSITDDDIPILLEIAGWLGRDGDMHGCLDAPLHAWEALGLLDPVKAVPGMLDTLNRIDWDEADHVADVLDNILAFSGKRSAIQALESGDASLDTIPLFLEAIKEKERHSTTRMVLADALCSMTWDFPEYRTEYFGILRDSLKELRIDCRDWYATAVCDLAFQENMPPETTELLKKICCEGYAEALRYWRNDGLIENVGFDYENVPKFEIHKKSDLASTILREFRNCGRTFPKRTIEKARELRDWIIPNLIEVVRNATAYARFGVPNRDGTVQFAVHLLAEFKATEALPAIEDSLSLSIDQIWDHLYADGFFEAMPGILHRLMGDDPEIYDQKLRDPSAPVALQCCLSRSIGYLVAKGIVSEETYCDGLRDYLEIAIREKKGELVTDLVCDILFAANPEDIPLVRSAFDNELVDEDRMPREEAEEWFQERSRSITEILPNPNRDFADAAKELSDWAWFEDVSQWSSAAKSDSPKVIDISDGPPVLHLSSQERSPIPFSSNDDENGREPLRAVQKIGRNDPCPCGSGKKYKKCCGK